MGLEGTLQVLENNGVAAGDRPHKPEHNRIVERSVQDPLPLTFGRALLVGRETPVRPPCGRKHEEVGHHDAAGDTDRPHRSIDTGHRERTRDLEKSKAKTSRGHCGLCEGVRDLGITSDRCASGSEREAAEELETYSAFRKKTQTRLRKRER